MGIMSRHCPGMDPANWKIEDIFEGAEECLGNKDIAEWKAERGGGPERPR